LCNRGESNIISIYILYNNFVNNKIYN